MSDTTEIAFLSATETAACFLSRELSPVEVTRSLLERIDAVNPGINAFCTVVPEIALAAARAAERRFLKEASLGPIDGVPFSLKDLTPTRGIRTTFGSRIHEHHVPDEDGAIAASLLRLGGVLLGKTNTPEFGARSVTENRLFGPTRNPWDPARIAGGSSGGAAAAVAAGLGSLAQGSDSAGSIRIPASACGVVGVRPTPGLVAQYPKINAWETIAVDGPLARTVRDAAMFLDMMVGRDPRDPTSVEPPTSSFLSACDAPSLALRIAASIHAGGPPVDPVIVRTVQSVVATLSALGHSVEDASPDFGDITALRRDLLPRIGAAYEHLLE